jgi:SH3-like domain-containing protein
MRPNIPVLALYLVVPLVLVTGEMWAHGAQAQTTTSPPQGNLAAPPHQGSSGGSSLGNTKPAASPPSPKAPAAAPREPVHQAGPTAKTPVVQPHGQTHAQKPKGTAGAKPAAPPAAAPAPSPAPAPTAPPAAAEPQKGTATGNPLPRFAALRTDEVNLRRGPGTRYPIDWVYKRHDLPVEIEREFEVWRLIVDPDGIKGWVHQATLTGRRSFIVTGTERTLRHDASDTSTAVAVLKPGVIGRIRSCDAGSDWCQMQVGDYRGYLKRDQFWGALPNEAVSN